MTRLQIAKGELDHARHGENRLQFPLKPILVFRRVHDREGAGGFVADNRGTLGPSHALIAEDIPPGLAPLLD